MSGRQLSLYHYRGCPFCTRVDRVIDRLGVDVQRRDIFEEPEHRRALLQARGQQTVPVLRIVEGDQDRWMGESRDIIAWLEAEFADAAAR